MSIEKRIAAIDTLQQQYDGRVICYVTSERRGMETKIAGDAIFLLRRHLESIGEVPKLGLLLVSRGGDTLVPWQIVTLIREYCTTFEVLAPYTAHSAATLISLGADSIYMTKMATLSPIDPTVANPFNPSDPSNPAAKVGISVEDVTAFIQLAKNQGIKDEAQLTQVFLSLTSHVHPLALGNVQRSHSQIRQLARNLLELHMGEGENEKINKIVTTLTEKLYTHAHMIGRREAAQIGLKVTAASLALDRAMWSLFDAYVEDLDMFDPFNPDAILGGAESRPILIERAFIESADHTDVFISEGSVRRLPPGPPTAGGAVPARIQLPPGVQIPQVAVDLSFEGWRSVR
jgi:ClpP class serine protease